MIFSIISPVVCALVCILLRKAADRKIKSAVVIAMQAVVTVSGVITVLSETVSTDKFTFAEGISVGFTSDITAKIFCIIIVAAWMIVSVYASVYMKHEKNE